MGLSRDGLDELETSVVDHVETSGTHIFNISPTAGRDDGFSYTIGMRYNFDHPELIAFGQNDGFRVWLLNEMRERVRNGASFEPRKRYRGIIEGYEVAIRDVPLNQIREHFGWALWFYRRFAYDAPFFGTVQVVIPDRAGIMPGESRITPGSKPVIPSSFARASPRAVRC